MLTEALAEVRRAETSLVFVAEPGPPIAPPPEPLAVVEEVVEVVTAESSSPAGLNPRYTFDTFIVGPSNQFAHAACRAVAEAPSRSYTVFFMAGGPRKTH